MTDQHTIINDICEMWDHNVRVRISNIKNTLKHINGATLAEIDNALLAMEKAGYAVIYQLDDPNERTADDVRHALTTCGLARHIIYITV